MDRFEYTIISWAPTAHGSEALDLLNQLGAEGWEAVGLAPRAAPASPLPGMGANVVSEMVILLKRRVE